MSRLGPARFAGIVAWTAVATGWVAAVITRMAPPIPQADHIAVAPRTTTGTVGVVPAEGVPLLPDGGLVIIRSVPRADPGAGTQIVVRQPPVVEPAPPRVVSSGS